MLRDWELRIFVCLIRVHSRLFAVAQSRFIASRLSYHASRKLDS